MNQASTTVAGVSSGSLHGQRSVAAYHRLPR